MYPYTGNNSIITRESLIEDLHRIGIKKGDILYVSADLSRIFFDERTSTVFSQLSSREIVDLLLFVVGDEGTLVAPAFTSSNFSAFGNTNIFFDNKTLSTSGLFSNVMLTHPDHIRSNHPTHSFVAIGKFSEQLLHDHSHQSETYLPVKKMILYNAKQIRIGTMNTTPGFVTVHFAEQVLLLDKLTIFPWLNNVYIRINGNLKLFRTKSRGLCSKQQWRLFSYYVKSEILSVGRIGCAYSILSSMSEAYNLEKNVLLNDKKLLICKNFTCMSCNARRWDRLYRMPLWIIIKTINKFFRLH
jgi:aminoglycoside N3'-acetyltransferase